MLLMIAGADIGSRGLGRASATILPAARIAFDDLDAGRQESDVSVQFSLSVEAPDPAQGSNGEVRIVEFQ